MIRVLIADDIEPLCKKYEKYINSEETMEVVGVTHSGKQAVQLAHDLKPDVILMDIEMETKTAGLDASEKILAEQPDVKIIILTVYEEDELVFEAFQNGITDYLIKNSDSDEIIACIQDAYDGCSPLRPIIANKIRREFQRVKKSEQSFLYCLHIMTQMTRTERDILELLSQGYSRAEICRIRCVELSTVKTQIKSILKKFNKSTTVEVIQELNDLKVFDYLKELRGN